MNTDGIEQKICSTVLDMMEEQSCFNIKVTELVRRVGISRSSFYMHFDSVLDVVDRIESDYIAGLPDVSYAASSLCNTFRLGQDYISQWELDESWEYIHNNMRAYQLLTGQNGEPLFRKRLENRSKRIGSAIFSELVPQAPADEREVAAIYFAGSRMAVYDWWAFHADGVDSKRIQKLAGDLYWETLDVVVKDLRSKYPPKECGR